MLSIASQFGAELANIAPFTGVTDITKLVADAISTLLLIGAIIVFVCLIWGGWQWLTSGGDEGALQQARTRLTHCLIGFAILAVSYAIALAVQYFFGLNIFTSLPYAPPSVPGPGTPPPVPTAVPTLAACPDLAAPNGGCGECTVCNSTGLCFPNDDPTAICQVECWSGGSCAGGSCHPAPGATYSCGGTGCSPADPSAACGPPPAACIDPDGDGNYTCTGPCPDYTCPDPYSCVSGVCAAPTPTPTSTPPPTSLSSICPAGLQCNIFSGSTSGEGLGKCNVVVNSASDKSCTQVCQEAGFSGCVDVQTHPSLLGRTLGGYVTACSGSNPASNDKVALCNTVLTNNGSSICAFGLQPEYAYCQCGPDDVANDCFISCTVDPGISDIRCLGSSGSCAVPNLPLSEINECRWLGEPVNWLMCCQF